MELRQSTEIKVRVGPFLDATDGKTPETGITLGAADQAEILKANGVATVDISGATWAAVTGCDGWYDLTITTSYSDTLGHLTVVVQDDSVCLPVFGDFKVVTANYWDSKYSTDVLQVDVTQWLGTAVSTPTTAGVPEVEIKPTTHCSTSGTVNVGSVDSGTHSDTCTDDTSAWVIIESSGTIDVELGFEIGVNRVPTNVSMVLYAAGSGDDIIFYAYNYLTSAWDKLNYAVLPRPGVSDTDYRYSLIQDHADVDGNVIIRMVTTGYETTEKLYIDMVNVRSIDAGSISNGVKLGAQGQSDVNAECDTALSDYDGPSNTEMVDAFTEIKGTTWAPGSDTLEHIRDKQTDIETDTAEIGTAGAGLTALGDTRIANLDATVSSRNSTVPDAAGTAATLHGVTDGKVDTAQSDLDKLTGTDGATLATLQGNYAPNKVVPDVAGTAAGLHTTTDGKVDAVQTDSTAILLDTGTTIPSTITTLQTDSTAIKAKTDNLPSGIAKNVALANFKIFMVLNSDHASAATGKTLTGTIQKDAGAFAALTNSITEISDGYYMVDLTQAEMNADTINLLFTNADCDDQPYTVYTT